jgi:trigger factor
MSEENQGATATENPVENATDQPAGTGTGEETFEYPVRVEDAGPATRKVHVEIPKARIQDKLEEQFKELRQQAAIPGFRIGHAPRKLVEKRFANEVRDQVRRELVSESYQQAVEKNKLEVIGEPVFDDPDAIQLKDDADLAYSFEVEVQPQFEIPDLKGLKIKRPKIEVTDENVQQAMTNLREQQGTLVPIEDRGAEPKDYLTADVHVKVDGNVVGHQHDAQIVLRPGTIAGIAVDDLDEQLKGLKSGETRTIKATAPENHSNEQIRGKEVDIEIALKDIKKLEPVEVNQEFLESLGFESEQELLDALREQMIERIDYDVKQAMREQVNQHLLETVNMELPNKLSQRQEQRIVQRRAMDLLTRGVSQEVLANSLEKLRGGAREEAIRELKLNFILQKIATDQKVDVEEAELNGRIAMLAAQRGERPEKLKQEMAKDGSLSSLFVQMREQKAIDKVLEDAEFEDVDVAAEKQKEESEKKSRKKGASTEKSSEQKPAEEKPGEEPPAGAK